MIEQFLILVQFMTRIPVPIKIEYSQEKLGKSIKFFPLVGLIIGLILFFIASVLIKFIGIQDYSKKQIIAICIILSELFVVGIIHLDGLADTFDALFSYASKSRMLEIMKDSRIGTNGVIVLIVYFLLKIILITQVISIDLRYLILYPIIARLSTSINAGLGKYARENGMSNGIIELNTKKDAIIAVIITFFLSFAVLQFKGLLIMTVAILFILLFMRMVIKKIDGITGDTMGASLELVSLIVLIFVNF